jgi:glucose/arabinose dehydrogenase
VAFLVGVVCFASAAVAAERDVALATEGAVASASSSYGPAYPVTTLNDDVRAGGYWVDATYGVLPDWVAIAFNGSKTIDRVVVYTLQDNYLNQTEPTDTQTFTLWGITDFIVQGWDGASWVTLATVAGNNLVKRTVTFAPFTTDRIRVVVTNALTQYSYVSEVEAWGDDAAGPVSVNAALASAGAEVSASTGYGPAYPVTTMNDGQLAGGYWVDGTYGTFPDWVQITFPGVKTIDRVVVVTLQDVFSSLNAPSNTDTFTLYGITDYDVQGWNGGGWTTLATVRGNNLVKRTVTFAPFATDRVRINVTGAAGGYSYITEIEAWTAPGSVDLPPPRIALQQVASGLTAPVDIEIDYADSGRLFIVEQTGQIRILKNGQLLDSPYLDISSKLTNSGEMGLLGVAFPPDFLSSEVFYINYTRRSDGATVIERYPQDPGHPDVSVDGPLTLLVIPQPYANHNGGQLRFGPDGFLYIGMGDGGSGNDPENRAQNLSTLLGKMLRVTGSGQGAPGNPFNNEIWALGLRNPWRFSFDRASGSLFIADVGQNAWEEIDYQPPGAGAGANYGWRVMEGASCTFLGGGPPCFDTSLTMPILTYGHDVGCAITGGYRYRGRSFPSMVGYYFYGDYCSGRIWVAKRTGANTWSTTEVLQTGFSISTFGEDGSGELYVADYDHGIIYHIVAP